MAGNRPNTTAAASETTNRKPITVQSMPRFKYNSRPWPESMLGTDRIQYAINKPARPLIAARTTLSVNNWRTMRLLDAPSESRTLISRARSAARAISRLATFRQASNRTMPTATARIWTIWKIPE